MASVGSVVLALLLDKLFGEPLGFHPLVGFGRIASWLERRLYMDSKPRGLAVLILVVVPFVAVLAVFQTWLNHWVFAGLILYLAVGWQSLLLHARRVQDALLARDIDLARASLARMVSRDTAGLDEQGIAKGAVESVLENGNDAIFAALFWFMVAGAPGVLAYRLVNTLDAMWGYRNTRYLNFGWATARLDDLLNLLPARLTALSYALAGNFTAAMHCWKKQAASWKSPNAGPVMAAGAGALGVVLGGSEVYHGREESRGVLGQGRQPDARSIGESMQLIQRTLVIWVAVIIAGGFFWAAIHPDSLSAIGKLVNFGSK